MSTPTHKNPAGGNPGEEGLNSRLEELRRLFYERSSGSEWTWDSARGLWYQIRGCFERWPVDDGTDVAVDYVNQHLSGGMVFFRQAPQEWLEPWLQGGDDPRLAMIQTLALRQEKLRQVGYESRLPEVLDDIDLLLQTPWLGNLKALAFYGVLLGEERALRLVRSPRLAELEVLWLSDCGVGDSVARAIAEAPGLENLVLLGLSHNNITDAGVELLASSSTLGGVPKDFGSIVGRHFAVGPGMELHQPQGPLKGLVFLDLSYNRITDVGARSLAASSAMGCLEFLRLKDNDITLKGIEALAESNSLCQAFRSRWIQSNMP